MKLAIFNVKYSANIGDGVIAECLEQAIRMRTGWSVGSIDLAGRSDWTGTGRSWARRLKLGLLQALPGPARDRLVTAVLGWELRTKLRPRWRRQLEGVDVAIFGGGQLIQDGDLNFPLKLTGALAESRRRDIPTAIFAVGASPSKSRRGFALFSEFFQARPHIYAAARDPSACSALQSFGCDAELCHDPGLLASRIWPVSEAGKGNRPLVGLGITHPVVLSHHASRPADRSVRRAARLYTEMARRLSQTGHDVLCFTNGAAEDEAMLKIIGARLDGQGGSIRIAPRPSRPRDLAHLIAGCHAIVAHRLHAAIVAYSYGVPAIGLRWDDKLVRFFRSVGLAGRAIAFNSRTAGGIDQIVDKAMAEGMDEAIRDRILRETESGIDTLVAALAKHRAEPLPVTVTSDLRVADRVSA